MVGAGNGVRITLLTPYLFRFEVGADDRATTTFVSRSTPAVPHQTSSVNGTLRIQVGSDVVIQYRAPDDGDRALGCSQSAQTDVTRAVRSPNYPNGVAASSAAQCCAICEDDAACNKWVFATDSPFCWPLASAGSVVRSAARTYGVVQGRRDPLDGLSVQCTAAGAPFVWTPASQPSQPLNGTFQALDCYSTPMQCYAQFWQAMQPGLLSRDGWATIDDTFVARFVPGTVDASWPWWNASSSVRDLYLLIAPGLDYQRALRDYMMGWLGGAGCCLR